MNTLVNKTYSDENYSLMAEVFEASSSAVIVIDIHGLVAIANKAALEMLGSDITGKKWFNVIKASFQEFKNDGHEISLKDGRKISVSTKPLSKGQLVELTDVTPTRRLQEQISHMERLSSLGKMAASLAHQIRTPLSAALLYAVNLSNSTLTPGMRNAFVKKLKDRLTDLECQIRDVLMFARAGEKIIEHVEVTELITAIKNNTENVLTRNGASMDIRMDDPPIDIVANKTALSSALGNLVSNAVEAGAKRIFFDVSKTASEVVIKIADNGKGMSEKTMQAIFEPFYTTKSNGTGLGLAVVKSVVSAHQGKIGLVSQEGKGTCFTITLPLAENNVLPIRKVA